MSLLKNIASYALNSKPGKQSSKGFNNWKAVNSVLIIADETHLKSISGFIGKAEKDGKQVTTAFIYKGKPEQAPAFEHEHQAISKKQLTVLHLPKEDVLSALNSKRTDVLINLGDHDNISLLALSKLTDASFKISRFENAIFDMSISGDAHMSVSDYLEQVYTYLNMIKN